eukprot:TRINITY_DN47850_c0_g1_i1.p1 TRINITY_DN47850_c0_g1~~TRINITY_DN47850_c0_g1_i1.p1  ORF type:complete len:500 (+),score=159.39 TRINITY_DN47850_c0_g1_i1:131-1630(+)
MSAMRAGATCHGWLRRGAAARRAAGSAAAQQSQRRAAAEAELARVNADIERQVGAIVRDVIGPADTWNLFGADVLSNRPAQPMVLLLGNHSSGKSTFINNLMGVRVQETGVAPTDDGFTVLMRGDADMDEDGPTIVGTQSHGFQDLTKYGPRFVNHFRLKVRKLGAGAECPKGLALVDSPGMIDTAMRGTGLGERGYDFIQVTRWFAKRADVVLLFFDPANPGTTSETLDVLAKSLTDLEHKTLLIMNKVDLFDSNTDFARAYGTLCWNLSKVIPRKDIPRIYTMFNHLLDKPGQEESATSVGLPLAEFDRVRGEVVREVMRAPSRRIDNLLTMLEQTAARLELVARVCDNLRRKYMARKNSKQVTLASCVLAVPALLAVTGQGALTIAGGTAAAVGMGATASYFIQNSLADYQRLLVAQMGDALAEEYAQADDDGKVPQDVLARWAVVEPRLQRVLANTELSQLPRLRKRDMAALEDVLEKRVPVLREAVHKARTSSA